MNEASFLREFRNGKEARLHLRRQRFLDVYRQIETKDPALIEQLCDVSSDMREYLTQLGAIYLKAEKAGEEVHSELFEQIDACLSTVPDGDSNHPLYILSSRFLGDPHALVNSLIQFRNELMDVKTPQDLTLRLVIDQLFPRITKELEVVEESVVGSFFSFDIMPFGESDPEAVRSVQRRINLVRSYMSQIQGAFFRQDTDVAAHLLHILVPLLKETVVDALYTDIKLAVDSMEIPLMLN